MRDYLAKAIRDRKEGKSYPFLVVDKVGGEIAGSTRLYEIDLHNKCCSLGYTWYGKKFQGTGVNKNCKYLLFEWAFEQLEFERIQFRADAQNIKSIQAIKSLGCTVEGILRSNLLKPGGGRRDSIVLSLLRDEWYSFAKMKLERTIKAK
jgi:N-acetyltransferase